MVVCLPILVCRTVSKFLLLNKFQLVPFSQHIEENAQKLQQTAKNYKNMEHGVHPALFGADAIEYCADGVGNTAGQ